MASMGLPQTYNPPRTHGEMDRFLNFLNLYKLDINDPHLNDKIKQLEVTQNRSDFLRSGSAETRSDLYNPRKWIDHPLINKTAPRANDSMDMGVIKQIQNESW